LTLFEFNLLNFVDKISVVWKDVNFIDLLINVEVGSVSAVGSLELLL